MIYDALLRQLETMCQELEVPVPEIDLSSMRSCAVCGEPFSIIKKVVSSTGKEYINIYPQKTTCSLKCRQKQRAANETRYRETNAPHRKYNKEAKRLCTCPKCGEQHYMAEPTDWRRFCPACTYWIGHEYELEQMEAEA